LSIDEFIPAEIPFHKRKPTGISDRPPKKIIQKRGSKKGISLE